MSARLIYSAICSLDGYVADERGNFDWAAPDDEVHAHVNELMRSIGTNLYGGRLYETMMYWERFEFVPLEPPPQPAAAAGRRDRVRGALA